MHIRAFIVRAVAINDYCMIVFWSLVSSTDPTTIEIEEASQPSSLKSKRLLGTHVSTFRLILKDSTNVFETQLS